MTRRQTLKVGVLGLAALATGALPLPALAGPKASAKAQAPEAPNGPFRLPPLPYPSDALEPAIDAPTMRLHHDKHHAAYVANLNKAIFAHPELGAKRVEDLVRDLDAIPEDIRAAVRNHGGGHLNHSLFWQMLAPPKGQLPPKPLADAIEKDFGSLPKFFEAFDKAALTLFGSGWAWLSLDPSRKLLVETTPNQDNPISRGHVPLLGLDVWEHAYYLKYQNRRADYVAAFRSVINWAFVADRYKAATA